MKRKRILLLSVIVFLLTSVLSFCACDQLTLLNSGGNGNGAISEKSDGKLNEDSEEEEEEGSESEEESESGEEGSESEEGSGSEYSEGEEGEEIEEE